MIDPGYRYRRDQDHEQGDPDDYCDHLFIHASPLRESASEQTAPRHRGTMAIAEANEVRRATASVRPRGWASNGSGVLLMGMLLADTAEPAGAFGGRAVAAGPAADASARILDLLQLSENWGLISA
jgi:hypothetical protein